MLNVSKKRLEKAERHADELIKNLSLTEKVGQISQFGTSIYKDEKVYYTDHYPQGTVGSYLTVKGAELTNRLQKECKEKFPTHIPLLFADDVIHGYATVLPTPLAQSCSWDPSAAKRGAEVAAKEAYSGGVKWTFSPMVDIARDPRWGRIVEGYGEDPYLCSRFSEAVVKGYQGDEIGEKDHLLACMKHFVGYGACVGGRDYDAVDMSLQTLFDVYLPSFKAGIDAGAATVMSAFHTFNGVPCTGNKFLLTDVLRGKLGFDGFVISDAGSVWEMITHGFVEDLYGSSVAALTAGLSMLMCGDQFNEHVPEMIKKGDITEKQIDEALRPILVLKDLLGLFEEPFVDEKGEECLLCAEHRAAAREIARDCIVMLENDGTLPLDKSKKVALIGALADDGDNVLGPWTCLKDPETTVTVLDGFKNAGYDVTYAAGSDILEGTDEQLDEAVKAAKNADVAVLVLGEAHEMSGEAKSRAHLRIPDAPLRVLDAVLETGTPVVLLISAGRPIIVEEYREKVAALAYVWQLGTEMGNAVADVISGEYEPTGRLTASVPRHEGQLPVYYDRNMTGRPYKGLVWYETGYKDMTTLARYPFGYGLGYTEFDFSDIRLSSDSMDKDGSIDVTCTVTNKGKRKGTAVAELYVRDLVASRVRPIKQLKGFCRVTLEPGESRDVTLSLPASSLAFCDENLDMKVEAGRFTVWMAKDSADESLSAEFVVK